ncbi:MAG: hypothetical protein M1827_005696 [Pycnora praestabilis]|nr:MAG: hypothetical protein M1827_005696 [Pycnora praestabilis]
MSDKDALPPALIETIAGFTAGVISTLAVHPLDVVKTLDRASSSRIGGSFRVIGDIARHEGSIAGFYRGLTPNIIGNSFSWALYFLWYGKIKDGLYAGRSTQDGLSSLDYFLAAGAAGALTAICTNPIWVIKTRMLSTGSHTPGAYRSVTDGVRQIMRTEGLSGFYRGLLPSLIGVSHGAVQFMAYEQLKKWKAEGSQGGAEGGQGLSNLDYLWLSGLSKVIAGSSTYPYQVVRSRLQTYDAGKTYSSARDAVVQIWRQEGLSGFYKGLGPNLVRVLPSTCITFLVYENTRFYLPGLFDGGSA